MLHLLLSVLAVLVAISMVPTILSDPINQPIGDFTVPSWIKNNAGWWAGGQIDDSSFVSGIQWLILNDVITIPSTQQGAGDGDNIIPSWVKNTAGWWAEDKIHDITFVSAIKYLINEGIMIVGQVEEAEETSECTFKGIPVTCPDEKEVAEISDFYMEVNRGSCTTCVSWAYVGKEYNFQIETYDEKRGNYIDGVEINVKIISKGGELRHNFGQVTTEDGIYKNSITIPSLDWYAENILSVTGKYYGVEKTIEKEFTVFKKGYSANPSSIDAAQNSGGSCTEVSPLAINSKVGWPGYTFTQGETDPQGLTFSEDGTKMFVVGMTNDTVYEYILGGSITNSSGTFSFPGPYCLGTAHKISAFNIADPTDDSTAIAFSNDGRKMFVVGTERDSVHEYNLSENFDVSTASYVDSFDVSGAENDPRDMAFDYSGRYMFILGKTGDDVTVYKLSEPFDVSTAVVQSG